MEKIVERIEETRACSTERAHEVESFINMESSLRDLNLNDTYVDDLQQLKGKLKTAKDNNDISDLVEETVALIERLANEKEG